MKARLPIAALGAAGLSLAHADHGQERPRPVVELARVLPVAPGVPLVLGGLLQRL